MYCKACNQVIADGSTFCCFCGSPVPAENNTQKFFCPKCNCEYYSAFPFCGTCGTKLIPVSNVAPPKPRNEIKISNTFTIPGYGMVILGTVVSGEINTGDVIKTETDSHKILRMEKLGDEIKNITAKNSAALLIDSYTAKIQIGSTVLCEDPPVAQKTTSNVSNPGEVLITPPPVTPVNTAPVVNTPSVVNTTPTPVNTIPKIDNAPVYEAGDAIMQINATSVYAGTKAGGTEILSGTVYIFADRIDTMSNISQTLTPLVKMSDIQSVSKSKYMHMWSSIIINLKNGNAYTLASASAGSAAIDRALQIINESIR